MIWMLAQAAKKSASAARANIVISLELGCGTGDYEGEDAGTVFADRLPPIYERSGVSKYQYEA